MSQRLAWPDVAKGVSILGVVALHVTLAVPGGRDSLLWDINTYLDPLRMPLFFLISGIFSTKVFEFTFRELALRRLWFFFVPYFVWVPIELFTKSYERHLVFGSDMLSIGDYAWHLLFGVNMAWFLYALTLFNIVLWITRRLPSAVAILLSFLPIVAIPLHTDYHIVGKAILYLPLFIIGAHLRTFILNFGNKALSVSAMTIAGGGYLLGAFISWKWDSYKNSTDVEIPWWGPGMDVAQAAEIDLLVRLSTHLLMIGAGIVASVLLSRIPLVSSALQSLGRNTLVLYIGHPISLTLLYHLPVYYFGINISPDAENWFHSTNFGLIYASFVAFLGGIIFYLFTRIPYLRWTLQPPHLIPLKPKKDKIVEMPSKSVA